MIMKRIGYILLGVMLAACYDDKGSYDYHDINEIRIEGIAGSYNASMGVSTLEIDPKVTMTIGDPEDTLRFAYEWRATIPYDTSWIIGTRRILKYPVALRPRGYTLYLRVKDRQTDVTAVATASLTVGTPYSRGMMLIGENQQGEADVQMLSMTQDTVLYKDILKNSGLPALQGPVDIIHTGHSGTDKNIKLWVLTQSGAYSMDRQTFKGSADNVFGRLLYMSEKFDSDFIPVDIVPRIKDKNGNVGGSSYYRAVVCSNGYIFNSSLTLMGGDYYMDPVNREGTDQEWLKAKPYLLYSLNNWSGFVWYDEGNERFMQVGSFASVSSAMKDWEGDPFPWNQGGTGRTMVYAENTLNTDGGATNGNSFAIMRDGAGNHFIYKFYVSTTISKGDCYTVSPLATDFGNADFYAFSSRRTVVYYSVGNRLYAYDYNKGNEKLYPISGINSDQITMLKCDTQIDPGNNPVYVATYNDAAGGTLQKYIQGTDPDKVELTPDPESCWTGLTKVKKMSWRAAN